MNVLLLWKKVENFSCETEQRMNLLSLINLLYINLFTAMCKKTKNCQTMNFVSFSMARARESLHLPNQNESG
jgi:hypothetical protein